MEWEREREKGVIYFFWGASEKHKETEGDVRPSNHLGKYNTSWLEATAVILDTTRWLAERWRFSDGCWDLNIRTSCAPSTIWQLPYTCRHKKEIQKRSTAS